MAEVDFDKLPPEVHARLAELDLIDRVRSGDGVDSVAAFGEYVFGVKPARHHLLWLERKLAHKRVVIVAPPESAKTTWAIVLMAWSIGKRPDTSNAFISATDTAAQKMAETVANCIEHNPRWRAVFPTVQADKDKGWSREGYWVWDARYGDKGRWYMHIATQKDPTLIAGGVGSVLVNGIRVTGRLECDDIHDRRSRHSEAVCSDTVSFLRDTVLSRVTEGAYLGIEQTRWSQKDSVAFVKGLRDGEGRPMYAVFEHPAIDENGESYWPEQWPLERLEAKRREITEIEFRLVYLCDDRAAQGQLLKKESLRYFPAPSILRSWQHYGGVDFAQKLQELSRRQEARHSRFAYAMLAHTGNVLVLVDGVADLTAMGESENQFFSFSDMYRPVRVGVEVNAQNRLFYNNLIRRKIEQGYSWLNIMPINTTRNMGVRMAEMEPDFRLGVIQVSDAGLRFLREFEEEWLMFGERGARDDILSAVHLARQAAYNLLPGERQEERRERAGRREGINRFRPIEAYYGVGGR